MDIKCSESAPLTQCVLCATVFFVNLPLQFIHSIHWRCNAHKWWYLILLDILLWQRNFTENRKFDLYSSHDLCNAHVRTHVENAYVMQFSFSLKTWSSMVTLISINSNAISCSFRKISNLYVWNQSQTFREEVNFE